MFLVEIFNEVLLRVKGDAHSLKLSLVSVSDALDFLLIFKRLPRFEILFELGNAVQNALLLLMDLVNDYGP